MTRFFFSISLCLLSSLSTARSIPDPHQTPAPGNETPQRSIQEADYSPSSNYKLLCMGCHLENGEGSVANDTPRMTDFIGHYLKVDGGREYLLRVPGVSGAALTDEQTAAIMNWILRKEGIAGNSMPTTFTPYTASEVAETQAATIKNVSVERKKLVEAIQSLGIPLAPE